MAASLTKAMLYLAPSRLFRSSSKGRVKKLRFGVKQQTKHGKINMRFKTLAQSTLQPKQKYDEISVRFRHVLKLH
eukprot:6207863-Pleurochrysis_carterae.AAC.1